MIKKGRLILSMGLIALLSACGTSNDQNNSAQPANTTEKSSTSLEQKDTKKMDESKEQANNNQTVSPENEKKLSYTLNGETKEEIALLKKSDNQNFSLYILPSYDLTGEEPGKDLLYLKNNDGISMRIEILPADLDEKELKENTIAQLKVVNENVITLDAPNDPFLQHATILEASKDGNTVTAYLIKTQNVIVKLTMFTTTENDQRNAFVEMAKTISINS